MMNSYGSKGTHRMTTTLSIIGFGAFGRFMASHLKDHFRILAADQLPMDDDESRGLGAEPVTIDQAARADIVVFAVPVQGLGEALRRAAPGLRPDAVVIDVCSVKIEPIDLMLRFLPASCRIIGLHPLFGPQSGQDGVAGLPVAFCPARVDVPTTDRVREFLEQALRLRVIDVSPDDHDRQMAYVQALTHFVSRSVGSMDLPRTPLATRAYERFLAMKSDLQNDSLDLFLTIERHNPYAATARRELTDAMADLERLVSREESDPGTQNARHPPGHVP